jgi:hypothetical protein
MTGRRITRSTNPDMDFSRWLQAECHRISRTCGVAITDARFFRVSSAQPSEFIANLTVGLAGADPADPDIAVAKEVGGLIVEQTQEGVAARACHGTLDLRRGMFDSSHSERMIGYATVFGSTLFIYLLASAASGDLADSEHPEDRGNAATQVMRTVMRELSTCGKQLDAGYRLRCHFTDETRAARSTAQASKLVATARRHQVVMVVRGTPWDPAKVQEKQLLEMLLGMAATERELVVHRVNRGKYAMLVAHRLPESLGSRVPFTHGPHESTRTDAAGREIPIIDGHRPVPRPGSGEVLTKLVRGVIDAADQAEEAGERLKWDALATELSRELGLYSRSIEHQALKVPLHELQGPGNALKRMLDERYRVAWRTGQMPWVTELTVVIEGLTDQLEVVDHTEDGNPVVRAWIDCPVPDGIDLTDAEWTRLDEILKKGSRAGRPPTGWQRPLRGHNEIVGEVQRGVQLHIGGQYRGEQRPADRAFDGQGKNRGWPRDSTRALAEQVEVVVAVNACVLHQAIGKDLEALAADLEGQIAALEVVPAPSNDAEGTDRDRLTAEIAELDDQIVDAEHLAAGARRELYRAAGNDDDAGREAAERDEQAFLAEAAERRASRDRLQRRLERGAVEAQAPDGHAQAPLSSLEEVAAALQVRWRADGMMPSEVVAAVRPLLRRSLRLTVAPGEERATWEVTVHLPLKDGRTGTYVRSGTVRAIHQGAGEKNIDTVARRFFWDDEDLASLGADLGIDGSGRTNSRLMNRLKHWLRQPRPHAPEGVPCEGRRRAVLDAPTSARRAIYALLTGRTDELTADGMDPAYLEVMEATYLDDESAWGGTWTAKNFRHQRQLISLILDQERPEHGVSMPVAMSVLGVDSFIVSRLGGDGCGVPAAAVRNWTRNDGTPLPERRLHAIACPWEDCPGHRSARGYRRRSYASHYLHVPEVPGALLCPTCRRAADTDGPFAGARFPRDYFLPYRRVSKTEDGTRACVRLETASWVDLTVEPVA